MRLNTISVRCHARMTRFLSTLALTTALPAVLSAGDRDEWLQRMMPITPRGYVCAYTDTPLAIDGKLDDSAWAKAPWTQEFLDIEGTAKPRPAFRTRAKLLWDRDYLYVAAELEEPHVWATLTQHDAVIFQDPDFEVFIDPDGDTHNYYEFEINALNTGWDLLLDKPYKDRGQAHNEWEIPGLKTAVHVQGTLNNPADKDTGWTVELAFPWKALAQYARHAGPPQEGAQWRLGFSRVEWQIVVENGKYKKVPKTPENNWVWSPQGVVDMHRPEMWGVVQFTRQTPQPGTVTTPLPGKPARDLALEVYAAQRDFYGVNKRWAATLAELGLEKVALPPNVERPQIASAPDGYTVSVGFRQDGVRRVWRVRQDRLMKLE